MLVSQNSDAIEGLRREFEQLRAVTSECPNGDVLLGAQLHHLEMGTGISYQVIGDSKKKVTWVEAYESARQRCFKGHKGYLAVVGNAQENEFIFGLIKKHPNFPAYVDTWLGATIRGAENFVWVGPEKEAEGAVFYNKGPVDGKIEFPFNQLTLMSSFVVGSGAYTNFESDAPDSKASSNICVLMRETGKWDDVSWYLFYHLFFCRAV